MLSEEVAGSDGERWREVDREREREREREGERELDTVATGRPFSQALPTIQVSTVVELPRGQIHSGYWWIHS